MLNFKTFRAYFLIAIVLTTGINFSNQQQIPLQQPLLQQQQQQQPLPYAPQQQQLQQGQLPLTNGQERVGAPGSLQTSVYQFLKQNQQTTRVSTYTI
jgi:hypothetical protein